MLNGLINKKYLFYGGSIAVSRGLEYFVIYFAAHYLTKSEYGELEYYKKFVEVGSNVLAFGFPALILSYTKSKESKIYFYVLSILFVVILGSILLITGFFSSLYFLIIPTLVFYALFFNGGIAQSYQLVDRGSNYASLYKTFISIFFYFSVFVSIFFLQAKEYAYLYPSLLLLPMALIFSYFDLKKYKIEEIKIKKYWKLFKKLLYSSLTLVVSNFANLLFLYTDIFIIKILSESANTEIADFSFALNAGSILLIISMTLIQVDIEKLKNTPKFISQLSKRITVLTILSSIFLILGYYCLVTFFYPDYASTFSLFLIILVGKIFLTLSNLYGTNLIILKKFNLNLYINAFSLGFNVLGCYFSYFHFGLIGLTICSSFMLFLRFIILLYFNKKAMNRDAFSK